MMLLEKSKSLIGANATAYLMIVVSNFFWVTAFAFGSEHRKLDFISISRWRGIGTVAMNAAICSYYGYSFNFPAADFWVLAKRNILTCFHALWFAITFRYMPAPLVHTIANAGPIIVYVIDYFKNGKVVTSKKIVGIAATTATLIITINSSLILYWLGIQEQLDSRYHYIESSAWAKAAIGLVLSVTLTGWAYGIVITKDIKYCSIPQINLHLGLMSCMVTDLICFI